MPAAPAATKDTYFSLEWSVTMSPTLLQGGAGVLFLLIGLLMLIVQLGIIVWIYSDAQQRSDQPAFLWAIVAFLAPLLGIVLYLIVGRNKY